VTAERVRALRRAAALVRAPDVIKVLGGVAAVLFCLELVYLAAGNALLRTSLIQKAVASADGFALEFGRAYTLWPGHARVHDLSLRVEDYNVQFEVAIAQADLDIALSELPFKKFHVTRLDAQGTRFRMRHKLIVVGDDAERVAAYPKIKGFADPPYYEGVHPPPISDAEADSDLWKIRIENVQASVSELWVMEYRYTGPGRARGSFVVHPTRWVQVEPAALWLDGGALSLGAHRVAARATGKITCDVPDMHVQAREGLAVLKDISAGMRLDLEGGQLDFLRAYLGRLGSVKYAGKADYHIDVGFVRGVVSPNSRVDVRATPLELRHDFASLRGDVMLSFRREAEPALKLAVSAPRLVAERARPEPAPYVEGLSGRLELEGADLSEPISLGAAGISVARAHADSLAWFAPPGTELSGVADAAFELSQSSTRKLQGAARLGVARGRIAQADFGLSGDVASQLSWARGAEPEAPLDFHELVLRLTSASLRRGPDRSREFDARLESRDLRLSPRAPPSASGTVRAHVSDTESLLPLVMGGPLKDITAGALNLKQLDAETSVQLSPHGLSLRVVDARSGNLRARGYYKQDRSEPRGAFLLSAGPLNVGVTLSHGETEVSPFVGDGWLAATWPRISQVSPGPG